MNHTWEPIVFITLTEFPSGHELHLNVQSIEAIEEIPEVPETKTPALKGMNGPIKTRPPEPAHTVVVSKSGVFYNVDESYNQIIDIAVSQLKKVHGV